MRAARLGALAVVAFAALLMVLPAAALLQHPLASPAPPTSSAAASPLPAAPSSGAAARIGAGPAPNGASASATPSLAQASLPSNCLQNGTPASGHITPCYLTTPVPMGLSDLGVAGSGTAYAYATSTFAANVTIRSYGAFSPGYGEMDSAPNWIRIALDTVAVNATYPHETAPGTFWIQNGAVFNGTTLTIEDNVWNFSGENLPVRPGTLAGAGTILEGEYYADVGPSFTIASGLNYPLYLDLTSSIANVSGHVRVELNYSLTENKTLVRAGTYDNVTFQGAAISASPPSFRVDGYSYNPAGLLYDAEVDFSGVANGANANLEELNASVRLEWWDTAIPGYATVRSAYDFGVDSGETALGVAAYYINTTGSRTEYLGQGPSILYGLWNTSAGSFVPAVQQGWTRITVQVKPSYAFLFETNLSGLHALARLANFSWTPTTSTGLASMFLPRLTTPGTGYVFEAWANGYDNSTLTPTNSTVVVVNNTTAEVSQTLTLTPASSEVNAPLYLDGDAQVGTFGLAGVLNTSYSVNAKTLWVNSSQDALAPPFLRLNDYSYPTFVLFAVENLSYSVLVNHFVQNSTAFTFTRHTNESALLPGWTQGYFFFGGSATLDSVENTTVEGNSALYHNLNPTYPPATVECYRTPACRAENVAASLDATGVTAIHVRSVTLGLLTAASGAVAAVLESSGNVTVRSVNAVGADVAYLSGGLDLQNDSNVSVTDLSASALAWGIVAYGTRDLNVSGISVTKNSPAFYLNYTNASAVANVAVDNESAVGVWANSTGLRLTNVTCAGAGAVFYKDTSVTVKGASATGFLASAIEEFNNSTDGQFSYINATDGATGVNLTYASDVTLTDLNAADGSLGANLTNVSDLTATGLSATNSSVALAWGPAYNVSTGLRETPGGSTGTITDLYVAYGAAAGALAPVSGSVGLNVSYVTGLTVRNVTAVGTPGLSSEMTLPTDSVTYDVAAVNLTNDTDVQLENVTTTYYPYAVVTDWVSSLTITEVASWYGNVSVILNNTSSVAVSHLFAYGDEFGAELVNNQTSVTISASTFEGCVDNGLNVTFDNLSVVGASITGNNFIATNGSSESGQYVAAHAQIAVNNKSSTLTFSANYFADHTGSGAYAFPNGSRDPTPSTSVVGSWLEFKESGLSSGTNWSFRYAGETYYAVVPRVYVPGWVLGSRPQAFTVPTAGGLKPSPSSGSVTWTGTNTTVLITFGTGLPFGFTLLELVALVGGIVAVVVAVILWRLLRKPPTPRNDASDASPARAQATPSSGDRHLRRYG